MTNDMDPPNSVYGYEVSTTGRRVGMDGAFPRAVTREVTYC